MRLTAQVSSPVTEKHPDPPRSFNNWSAWRTWRRTTTRSQRDRYVSVAERHTVRLAAVLKSEEASRERDERERKPPGPRRKAVQLQAAAFNRPAREIFRPFSPCHAYLRSVRTRQLKLIVLLVTVARRSLENIPPSFSFLQLLFRRPVFCQSSLHSRGMTSSRSPRR